MWTRYCFGRVGWSVLIFSKNLIVCFCDIHGNQQDISNFISTELEWIPENLVNLNGDNKDNMIKFLEALDDDDDVQNIFTNAKFEN